MTIGKHHPARCLCAALALAVSTATAPLWAQTAPSAAEVAAYDGLHLAAHQGDAEAIARLAAAGADLVARDRAGRTPAHVAGFASNDDALRALAAAGAPLDHVNNLGWTALIEAVILGDGGPDHIATVQALVAAGADAAIGDADGVTPLRHAEMRGYTRIADLIRAGQAQ